jgi:hypothetical protein
METEVVCEKCMHVNIFKERLLKDEEGFEKSTLKEVKIFKRQDGIKVAQCVVFTVSKFVEYKLKSVSV